MMRRNMVTSTFNGRGSQDWFKVKKHIFRFSKVSKTSFHVVFL